MDSKGRGLKKRKRNTASVLLAQGLAPRSLAVSASAPRGARCLVCRAKDPEIRFSVNDQIYVWVCGRCENFGVKAVKLSLLLTRVFG
jgi:hypothetical protein